MTNRGCLPRTALWIVLALGAVSPAAAQAGCFTVAQTGWVSEVASIPLSTTVSFGPDKARLACEFGWEQIDSMGAQRCATNFSDGTLYRNPALQLVQATSNDCSCQEGFDRTDCQISTSVQCTYEVYRTAGTQICN